MHKLSSSERIHIHMRVIVHRAHTHASYTLSCEYSRTRKPQPHYPKYSSVHIAGTCNFASGFYIPAGCWGKKKRRHGDERARWKMPRGRGGRRTRGRSVILPRLPVISRFYSGKLARRRARSRGKCRTRSQVLLRSFFKGLLAHENADGTGR